MKKIITKSLLSQLAFALFFLRDFYFGDFGSGIRAFDFIGLIVLFSGLVANNIQIKINKFLLVFNFCLLYLILYGFIGLLNGADNLIRPFLGIFIGFMVASLYYSLDIKKNQRLLIYNLIIYLSCTILFSQLIAYYLFESLLNFQQFIGQEPRLFYIDTFRPAGLFMEPSEFCSSLLMILFLRKLIIKNIDKVDFIALSCIILTLSLYGVISAAIFFLIFSKRSFKDVILIFTILLVISLFASNANFFDVVLQRFLNISEDGGFLSRYGALIGFLSNGESVFKVLFGIGFLNMNNSIASSGFGFLIQSIGLVGIVIFFALVNFYSAKKNKKTIFFGLCLILFAAPLFTTMFWWAWLGIFMSEKPNNDI